MDALQMLIDEVALEGLDGITIASLWIRLEDRSPKFPLKLDQATKEFLWKSLVCDPDIEFHELPRERAQVELFERFGEIDPETGIQEIRWAASSSDIQEDIYPINIILENEEGIQGSCQFFEERKNISSQVRTLDFKPHCSLETAIDKWGEKLVIVASQKVRFRALIGFEGDPDLKLGDHSYCILERLGRARWRGEFQRDLHSRVFKTDAGKMHYLRKSLDKNGLITLQSHVIRMPSGGQQYSILILLKRFHMDRRSKYDILMEKISNILAACPGKMCVMLKLREEMGLSERTFKRVYQYMIAAKLIKLECVPLEELNPDAGPCKTKKGKDIIVRCAKLLREYGKKDVEDEDENDEDGCRDLPLWEGPVREQDILKQAYEIVISTGTRGISQTGLRLCMNIGKLESRMLCRLLERIRMVKGLVEDEGRQRTTKYISKKFVEQSDLNRQLAKEKARSEQLRTGETVVVSEMEVPLSPREPVDQQMEEQLQPPSTSSSPKKAAVKSKGSLKDGSSKLMAKQTKLKTPNQRHKPSKQSVKIKPLEQNMDQGEASLVKNLSQSAHSNTITGSGSVDNEACVTIIEEVGNQKESTPLDSGTSSKRHAGLRLTYRLLKRKNLIIETIRSVKLIDNVFLLQKMIVEAEREEGVATKCCKKSILRLLRTLSKEGMLKLYCTTVIQDGISKKVEFVVHPSITPDDPLVKSAIEQIRFRLSSSYSALRVKTPQADDGEKKQWGDTQHKDKPVTPSKAPVKKGGAKELKNFTPSIVPGLGRSLGFQPKIPRLRVVHFFLWYLIYGHPMRRAPAENESSKAQDGTEPGQSESANERAESTSSNQTKDETSAPDCHLSELEADEDQTVKESENDQFEVFVDEVSWRRFIPPTPLHREFGYGWALTSDILLSLPLSLFIQIIQVSYTVDNLEAYLNDPVKQHYLIRFLPWKMRKQLLYRRRYVFSFHECMQRLCCMGLLQFGPIEKFQDKDQIFVYLKKKATIVDTTTCEPHYNVVMSSRPFEHRSYTFDTQQDMENYWFDLQCVCLNTPLGLIRGPRKPKEQGSSEKESEVSPPDPADLLRPDEKCFRMFWTMKGSSEVTDDGTIPGDGKGAGGLDSCFFGHLKRNWIWTSYLLTKSRRPDRSFEGNPTLRLNSLLCKRTLPLSLPSADKMKSSVGLKLPVIEEDVQITTESSDRKSRVVGGKTQKRKKQKKESAKLAKKKKKAENASMKQSRLPFHDEADLIALKRMTRQRVAWTIQEDSLLMLCRVASHFLNRKIKRPFVPWQVVRDILHAQFEESLDKTSLSVGRRSRYIMKNPQTYLNFKMCLAEIHQDKALIEEFQGMRGNYEDPEVCASEFKEFVAALKQKFSAPSADCSFEIPNTKEELFKRFKVCAIAEDLEKYTKDQLTSDEDIHSLILNNLIQSTLVMSNAQMRSCRSFQTFHIYSRFRQEVLYQAFLKLKKKGLVNRRRVHKIFGPKKCRAMPFLPMSYQLSQTYYRCFTWRIPNTTCTEAYEFLQTLLRKGKEDRPCTFIFQNPEESESEPEPESDTVLFPLDAPGGACVAGISLMVMGLISVELSIPEQIVVVDSTLVENEVMKSAGKDLGEDDDDEDLEEGEGKRKFDVKASQASHTNYLLMRGYAVPGIVNQRNLNTNDNVVVNSCAVRMKLRNTPAHNLFTTDWDGSFIDRKVRWEARLPKHLTHLIRNGSDSSNLECFSDRCVNQYGYSIEDVRAALDICGALEEAGCFGCDRLDLAHRFSALEEVQNGRTRTFYQYLQDLLKLEEALEVGGSSVRVVAFKYADPWLVCTQTPDKPATMSKDFRIQKVAPRKRSQSQVGEDQQAPPRKRAALETGEEGPSEGRSKEAEQAGSLAPEVMDTSDQSTEPNPEAGVSAQMTEPADGEGRTQEGGEEVRSTAPGRASPTPTCSTSDTPAQTSVSTDPVSTQAKEGGSSHGSTFHTVSFIGRPWRILDGSLNKPVCKGMLESLLFHVMSKPGASESTLIEHYSGVLQPIVVLDLLKGLEEIGCLRKRYVEGLPRASLFSPARIACVKEEGMKLRDKANAFYEPTLDCCLRLAKVFPHEANWNKWVQFIHS
ncbi:hypothetical protein GJAV_G00263900 [Gymnothorax javanicus]|nr:hypothetical protein GJAV_G00263900 [Gymnothorax javanicus]